MLAGVGTKGSALGGDGEYRSLETTWHDDMEKGFVSMGLVRSIGIRGIGGSIYQSSKYLVINYRIYSV